MKVIIAAKSIYPFHPYGGVQKYTYFLAKYLTRRGITVEIVAPLDNGKPRTEVFEGIAYTFLWPSIFWYLEYPIGWLGVHIFSFALARYLRNKEFDVLHSFDAVACRYLTLKKRKPVISQIFTDNFLTNPIPLHKFWGLLGLKTDDIKLRKIKLSPYSPWYVKARYFLQYLLKVKPMQTVCCLSERICLEEEIFSNDIKELFRVPDEKITVIPVGTEEVKENASPLSVTRETIGFSESDVVLITVNRLAADKGVDKVILALDRIRKEVPQIKLIVVGDGYQKTELLNLVAERKMKGCVEFFHNVPEKDILDYYRLADIYISAFSYPGSSLSTLEAMACGLPIVTTAQPWLVKDGKNGMAIDNNSPALIKEAVLKILNQKSLTEMGGFSFEISREYLWPAITAKAEANYHNLLSVEQNGPFLEKVSICGVGISTVNLHSARLAIEGWVERRQKTYVCVVPASTVVECQSNSEYKTIVNRADMATPDGMPLVWLGRLKGYKMIERTYGPDLMRAVCQSTEKQNVKHYFYGATEKTCQLLQSKLKEGFPDIKICGAYSPPFHDLSSAENDRIVETINRANPDIVWVGLGSPKQDFWMERNRDKLNAPVMIAVGAAFDFVSGAKKQAPFWMQRCGLEWFFRLMTEPRRLWRRYLIGNTKFIFYLLKDFFRGISGAKT